MKGIIRVEEKRVYQIDPESPDPRGKGEDVYALIIPRGGPRVWLGTLDDLMKTAAKGVVGEILPCVERDGSSVRYLTREQMIERGWIPGKKNYF